MDELLEFEIPTPYVSAIINADNSGLSEEDDEELDEFINDVVETYGNANFMLGDKSDDSYFSSSNDINNLGGDITILYLQPSKEYSFGGGVAVGGIVGAYLGYKIGRGRPQKAGFETEKKIGRRIKKEGKKIAGDMTISKKKPQTMEEGGMIGDYEVGDIVRIGDTDNENYDGFRGQDLRITDKATNENEHFGFDSSMDGYGLYDLEVVKSGKEVPFSLYDYELELSYAKGGEVRRFRDIFGEEIIYKEEKIGNYVIGIVSGFNDNRHIFLHEGSLGRYGTTNSLPLNFRQTSQLRQGSQTESAYRQLKEILRKNPSIETFKALKEIKYAEGGDIPTQEEVDKFFSDTQNEIHYLNSKPVQGQKGSLSRTEIEAWDEYDLSNWNALVRKSNFKDVYGRFKDDIRKSFGGDKYAEGGKMSKGRYISPLEKSLTKELHKLQRDLNSKRLQTYTKGDTSKEEQKRQKEREVKIRRFNEVLEKLNELDKLYYLQKEKSFAKGGSLDVPNLNDGDSVSTYAEGGSVENFMKKPKNDYEESVEKFGKDDPKSKYLQGYNEALFLEYLGFGSHPDIKITNKIVNKVKKGRSNLQREFQSPMDDEVQEKLPYWEGFRDGLIIMEEKFGDELRESHKGYFETEFGVDEFAEGGEVFKKGDKVKYLGQTGIITKVEKDIMDRTYYSVSYISDSTKTKTKVTNIYNKGNEITKTYTKGGGVKNNKIIENDLKEVISNFDKVNDEYRYKYYDIEQYNGDWFIDYITQEDYRNDGEYILINALEELSKYHKVDIYLYYIVRDADRENATNIKTKRGYTKASKNDYAEGGKIESGDVVTYEGKDHTIQRIVDDELGVRIYIRPNEISYYGGRKDTFWVKPEDLEGKKYYNKGGEIGSIVRISKTPYMTSFSDLYDKDLKIKDIKTTNFASGVRKEFIVELNGKTYEIPQDMLENFEKGGNISYDLSDVI